jgi:hypothetical protein
VVSRWRKTLVDRILVSPHPACVLESYWRNYEDNKKPLFELKMSKVAWIQKGSARVPNLGLAEIFSVYPLSTVVVLLPLHRYVSRRRDHFLSFPIFP